MDHLFISANDKLLADIRKLHNSMPHKNIELDFAFKAWTSGMIYSNPELCVASAKNVIRAAVKLKASLLHIQTIIDNSTDQCGALTKDELKTLVKLQELDL